MGMMKQDMGLGFSVRLRVVLLGQVKREALGRCCNVKSEIVEKKQ